MLHPLGVHRLRLTVSWASPQQREKLQHLRVQVDVVGLHAGFVSRSVWIPSVHLELLYSGLCCWSRCCLGIPHCLRAGTEKTCPFEPSDVFTCQSAQISLGVPVMTFLSVCWGFFYFELRGKDCTADIFTVTDGSNVTVIVIVNQ